MILIKYITTVPKLLDLKGFGFPKVEKEQLKFCLKNILFYADHNKSKHPHPALSTPSFKRPKAHPESRWSHDNPNSDLPKERSEALEAPSLQRYLLQTAASLYDDSEQTCP